MRGGQSSRLETVSGGASPTSKWSRKAPRLLEQLYLILQTTTACLSEPTQ